MNYQMFARDAQQLAYNFVVNQTSAIEAQVVKIQYPEVQYPDLVPVDTQTGNEWVKSITYYSADMVGRADWFHHTALDVPLAELTREKFERGMEMAAMIVESQKQLPEAKKRYSEILQKNPRASVAANNLAWLFAEEGTNLDEALKLAKIAVEVSPERAEMHDTLGWVYYRKELGPDGKPIPILLNKRIIASGEQLVGATSGYDSQSGTPMVAITLNGVGGQRMFDYTSQNVGKPMAVVYIERIPEVKKVDGQEVRTIRTSEQVISVATIQGVFGPRFQTTGIESMKTATELALLLRAGSLAAPVDIVEQHVIGPSLGQDNINKGVKAVIIGLLAVLACAAVYYHLFGLIADIGLILNLVLLVAVLSMFQATLTMPRASQPAAEVGNALAVSAPFRAGAGFTAAPRPSTRGRDSGFHGAAGASLPGRETRPPARLRDCTAACRSTTAGRKDSRAR